MIMQVLEKKWHCLECLACTRTEHGSGLEQFYKLTRRQTLRTMLEKEAEFCLCLTPAWKGKNCAPGNALLVDTRTGLADKNPVILDASAEFSSMMWHLQNQSVQII